MLEGSAVTFSSVREALGLAGFASYALEGPLGVKPVVVKIG